MRRPLPPALRGCVPHKGGEKLGFVVEREFRSHLFRLLVTNSPSLSFLVCDRGMGNDTSAPGELRGLFIQGAEELLGSSGRPLWLLPENHTLGGQPLPGPPVTPRKGGRTSPGDHKGGVHPCHCRADWKQGAPEGGAGCPGGPVLVLRCDCWGWRHGIAEMTRFVGPSGKANTQGVGRGAGEAAECPRTGVEVPFQILAPNRSQEAGGLLGRHTEPSWLRLAFLTINSPSLS